MNRSLILFLNESAWHYSNQLHPKKQKTPNEHHPTHNHLKINHLPPNPMKNKPEKMRKTEWLSGTIT
jgi:hypothetical protein